MGRPSRDVTKLKDQARGTVTPLVTSSEDATRAGMKSPRARARSSPRSPAGGIPDLEQSVSPASRMQPKRRASFGGVGSSPISEHLARGVDFNVGASSTSSSLEDRKKHPFLVRGGGKKSSTPPGKSTLSPRKSLPNVLPGFNGGTLLERLAPGTISPRMSFDGKVRKSASSSAKSKASPEASSTPSSSKSKSKSDIHSKVRPSRISKGTQPEGGKGRKQTDQVSSAQLSRPELVPVYSEDHVQKATNDENDQHVVVRSSLESGNLEELDNNHEASAVEQFAGLVKGSEEGLVTIHMSMRGDLDSSELIECLEGDERRSLNGSSSVEEAGDSSDGDDEIIEGVQLNLKPSFDEVGERPLEESDVVKHETSVANVGQNDAEDSVVSTELSAAQCEAEMSLPPVELPVSSLPIVGKLKLTVEEEEAGDLEQDGQISASKFEIMETKSLDHSTVPNIDTETAHNIEEKEAAAEEIMFESFENTRFANAGETDLIIVSSTVQNDAAFVDDFTYPVEVEAKSVSLLQTHPNAEVSEDVLDANNAVLESSNIGINVQTERDDGIIYISEEELLTEAQFLSSLEAVPPSYVGFNVENSGMQFTKELDQGALIIDSKEPDGESYINPEPNSLAEESNSREAVLPPRAKLDVQTSQEVDETITMSPGHHTLAELPCEDFSRDMSIDPGSESTMKACSEDGKLAAMDTLLPGGVLEDGTTVLNDDLSATCSPGLSIHDDQQPDSKPEGNSTDAAAETLTEANHDIAPAELLPVAHSDITLHEVHLELNRQDMECNVNEEHEATLRSGDSDEIFNSSKSSSGDNQHLCNRESAFISKSSSIDGIIASKEDLLKIDLADTSKVNANSTVGDMIDGHDVQDLLQESHDLRSGLPSPTYDLVFQVTTAAELDTEKASVDTAVFIEDLSEAATLMKPISGEESETSHAAVLDVDNLEFPSKGDIGDSRESSNKSLEVTEALLKDEGGPMESFHDVGSGQDTAINVDEMDSNIILWNVSVVKEAHEASNESLEDLEDEDTVVYCPGLQDTPDHTTLLKEERSSNSSEKTDQTPDSTAISKDDVIIAGESSVDELLSNLLKEPTVLTAMDSPKEPPNAADIDKTQNHTTLEAKESTDQCSQEDILGDEIDQNHTSLKADKVLITESTNEASEESVNQLDSLHVQTSHGEFGRAIEGSTNGEQFTDGEPSNAADIDKTQNHTTLEAKESTDQSSQEDIMDDAVDQNHTTLKVDKVLITDSTNEASEEAVNQLDSLHVQTDHGEPGGSTNGEQFIETSGNAGEPGTSPQDHVVLEGTELPAQSTVIHPPLRCSHSLQDRLWEEQAEAYSSGGRRTPARTLKKENATIIQLPTVPSSPSPEDSAMGQSSEDQIQPAVNKNMELGAASKGGENHGSSNVIPVDEAQGVKGNITKSHTPLRSLLLEDVLASKGSGIDGATNSPSFFRRLFRVMSTPRLTSGKEVTQTKLRKSSSMWVTCLGMSQVQQ